jgi:hypothetical protein
MNDTQLKWNRHPPAEPGWYWMRSDIIPFPKIIRFRMPDIFSPHKGSVQSMDAGGKEISIRRLYELVQPEWAGPIPLPVESE